MGDGVKNLVKVVWEVGCVVNFRWCDCGMLFWFVCVVVIGFFNVGKLVLINRLLKRKVVESVRCFGVIK